VRHELLKRRSFLEDYREVVRRIADANPVAADRFCDAVEAALEVLASHPEMGPAAGFPRAPEVRMWPLRRYPNYLLFYRVAGSSIVMLRLLHGAQDLPPLIPNE
jgi:plasmid stabilization system protein ParE